jgi:hypothetical protein
MLGLSIARENRNQAPSPPALRACMSVVLGPVVQGTVRGFPLEVEHAPGG